MSILDFDIENIDSDYYLEAIMEFDVYVSKIAQLVQERDSVELPLSVDGLAAYNNFIDNVVSTVAGYHHITEQYQSAKSYAYYVKFKRCDKGGSITNKNGLIVFRVATHVHDGVHNNTTPDFIFKDFILGDKKYPGTGSLIDGVRISCEAIRDDNLDELDNC